MHFMANLKGDVDLFCLQEVFSTTSDVLENAGARTNVLAEISAVLGERYGYFFDPVVSNWGYEGLVDFDLSFGLATFFKKSLRIHSHGSVVVYPGGGMIEGAPEHINHPRNLQYFNVLTRSADRRIANLHGLWIPGKEDSPERIAQSQAVRRSLRSQKNGYVLAGDFNLDMHTQSLSILAAGNRNLVKEVGAPTTRSSFYPRHERYADYIIVSPDIEVNNFKVLRDEVSDHLPLMVEFE